MTDLVYKSKNIFSAFLLTGCGLLLLAGCTQNDSFDERRATQELTYDIIGKATKIRIVSQTTGKYRCLAGEAPEGMFFPAVLIRNEGQYEDIKTQLDSPKNGWPTINFQTQRLLLYGRGKATRVSIVKVIEDLEKMIAYTEAEISPKVVRGPMLTEGVYAAAVLESTANEVVFEEHFSNMDKKKW